MDRLKLEFDHIRAQHGEIEAAPDFSWFIIPGWSLVSGWNKTSTAVLILVPLGYPTTPPDNFYTDDNLRLSSGQLPSNASAGQSQVGRQWLQFSYHLEEGDWQPKADFLDGHNLLTFLIGVGRRLAEAN